MPAGAPQDDPQLSSDNPKKRAIAVRALSATRLDTKDDRNRLKQQLTDYLDDPEPRVRYAALEAIGELAHLGRIDWGDKMTFRLIELTQHESAAVRAEASVALVLVDDPPSQRTVRTLVSLLGDPHEGVRREAAAALGDTGDRSVTGPLGERLTDDDPDTRFEVAFALASLGDNRGLNILTGALDKTRRRLDACEGLRRLGDPQAIPALERILAKMFLGWPERLTLRATLYTLGQTEQAQLILSRIKSWNRAERALAVGLIGSHQIHEGTQRLIELASNPGKLRDTAVRALGDLGSSEAQPVLQMIAEDETLDSDLRNDAAEALEKLSTGTSRRRS